MKATELMIGDYVQATTPLERCKAFKVVEIRKTSDEYYWLYVAHSHDDFMYTHINNFAPIPLTPEILEKNGFEHKPAPHWITDKDKEKDYYLQKTLDEIVDEYYVSCRYFHKVGETILDISTNNRLSFNGVIRYVHQLQHALRLCGIEKEIEL